MKFSNTNISNPLMIGKRAKRLRHEKKLSIDNLVKITGLNKNTIVRFEHGKNTRIETIYKICEALGTTPFHLIEGKLTKGIDYSIVKRKKDKNGNPARMYIKRKNRIKSSDFGNEGLIIGDLNYKLPDGELNATVFEIFSKGHLRSHPGEEILYCLTGKVGIQISEEKFILNKGDAFFFWGEEPHMYFNADNSKEVSVALSIWVDKNEKNVTYHI